MPAYTSVSSFEYSASKLPAMTRYAVKPLSGRTSTQPLSTFTFTPSTSCICSLRSPSVKLLSTLPISRHEHGTFFSFIVTFGKPSRYSFSFPARYSSAARIIFASGSKSSGR